MEELKEFGRLGYKESLISCMQGNVIGALVSWTIVIGAVTIGKIVNAISKD